MAEPAAAPPPPRRPPDRKAEPPYEEETYPPSPFDNLSWIQRLTFDFVTKIVRRGLRKPLQQEDLDPVARADRAARVTAELEAAWRQELLEADGDRRHLRQASGGTLSSSSGRRGQRRPRQPSLWRAIYRCNRATFWTSGVLILVESVTILAKPVMLRFLLTWLQQDKTGGGGKGLGYGYGLAVGLVALDVLQLFVHHGVFFITIAAGWRLRTAATGLLYRKILRLGSQWQSTASTGQIVSMISNDAQRYEEFATSMHFMWASPLSVAVGFVLLVIYVGWQSALVGCLVTIGAMPLQVWCGRQVGKARRVTAGLTDKRVKLMAEVLAGIQSVKAFVWEAPFERCIAAARELERRSLAWAMGMRALTMAIFFFAPSLAAFVTFVTYWALGHALELPTVFAVMSLLQVLREAARWIPRSIEQASEAHVATTRIQPFLLRPEVSGGASDDDDDAGNDSRKYAGLPYLIPAGSGGGPPPVLEIEDSDFSWDAAAVAAGDGAPAAASAGTAVAVAAVASPSPSLPPPRLHLRGVSLAVRPGELLVVAGTVGCGKSTLLDAMLGEAACVRGDGVRVAPGSRLAFCSQQPWIQAGTIRDNVLFAAGGGGDGDVSGARRLLDPDRYDRALAACALTHDLAQLPAGDMTPIGELGVNLSGGQRARVALARAVYADADLYLLDDVLSAVDARVSKHLFHQCIRGELRGKAVVLVTHQVQYLPFATRVLLLDSDGRMLACAPWDELKSSVPDWRVLVEEEGALGSVDEIEGNADEDEEDEEMEAAADAADVGKGVIVSSPPLAPPPAANGVATTTNGAAGNGSSSTGDLAVATPLPTPLPTLTERTRPAGLENTAVEPTQRTYILAEDRVQGGVGGDTYLNYWRSGGVGRGLVVAALLLVAQGLIVFADWWLKIWAAEPSQEQRRDYYPSVYAAIIGVAIVLGFLRAHLYFRFCLRASTTLHDKALGSVLAAPLSFFNANPRGRILNKFAKDLDNADDLIPWTLFDFLQSGLLCLAAVVVGCVAVPYLILLVAPLAWGFVACRRAFVATAREVKRLDSISRSPVYAEVSSSLVGAKTIRAFRAGRFMDRRFLHLLDENGTCGFHFIVLSRWLGFRLDGMCTCFLAVLCVLVVALREQLDTGLLALSLTYALTLSGMFQWAIRQSAQTETLLTSVERLHHYAFGLPREGIRRNPTYLPPPGWPDRGEIVVKDLSVRYREDLPIVLRGVDFTIPAGRKVGVIGRTGSGKSSFLAALLRLNEIVGGDITVDGVSLTRLGLADARGGVAWIPQDPNLFAGTLRFNLDPFSRFSDAEIWRALEDVQLKDLAPSLDTPVSEGGANLSTGQRQLLSLARAVLLRKRVLLMDEATANIDMATDKMIQETLRTAPAFRGCTIVTIAHRLDTVMDSDVILVFRDGKCVEQGAPSDLLASPGSAFGAMVREAEGMRQGKKGKE